MGGETRRKGRLPPRRKPARCLRPSQFRRRRPQSSYPWQKPSKSRRTHVRPPSNSGGSGVTAPAARSVLPKEEGCPTAVQQGFLLSEPARHGGPDPAPGSPAVCSTRSRQGGGAEPAWKAGGGFACPASRLPLTPRRPPPSGSVDLGQS